jgi:RHS repeat-associated protein
VTVSRGTIAYGYDAAGRISSLTDPGGIDLSFTYDGALPLTETWAGSIEGVVSRTFTNNFKVATEQVNGTSAVTFGYDADRLLTSAGALTIARHPSHGLVTGTTLDTTTETFDYNEFGEPTGHTARVGGSSVFDVQTSRDALGRITQRIETVDGITRVFVYGYDLAGRLWQVHRNGTLVVRYTYDSNGNRLTAEGEAGLVEGTYDDQDRVLTYGGATYTYTANGELTSKTIAGQTTGYVYDTLGNLVQVTQPNGTVIAYAVDGRGRRVGKSVNGVLVQGWLYADRLRPIAELDGAGVVVSRFVYGLRANVPEYLIKGGTTYRIFADHLGSPRVIVDAATGAVVHRMDFGPFGEVQQNTNPGWQPFGFAGGLYDSDTGLVRFGARDYDAQAAHWTSKDPIGFAANDPNVYGYVLGDPVNFVDPEGLDLVLTVGLSATAGANLGFGIPFMGGGWNFGINFSTGQLFLQAQANITVGAGGFAGIGGQFSLGYTCGIPSPLSTEESFYAEANAGAGLAAGRSLSVSRDGGSIGRDLPGRLRFGVGYGIHAGVGISTTTTLASPVIWRVGP